MKYVKLGNSDLRVSRICLGCMGFGDPTIGQHSWTIGEEPTREIIRRSLDLGVNFFDTAITYQLGTSEQYVGRALRDMARREDVVVATKFLPRTDEEIANGINGHALVVRRGVQPGERVTYYWGSAWSKYDCRNFMEWMVRVKALYQELEHPLKVSIE